MVFAHRPSVREERRLWLRSGVAGDSFRSASARPQPPKRAAQFGGFRPPIPVGPPEAGPPDGPQTGGALPVAGGAASGPAHHPLPRRRPQGPAFHEGGRRYPGADRGDEEQVKGAVSISPRLTGNAAPQHAPPPAALAC